MSTIKRRRRPHLVSTPLRKKGVITIPQEIREALDLQEGDHLVMAIEDGRIVMTPASVIPDDQAWFWTPEWQAKEREVDEAIAAGEEPVFVGDGEAFIAFLTAQSSDGEGGAGADV
jgi:AbrB family looped-hinge helix DNA binding protein